MEISINACKQGLSRLGHVRRRGAKIAYHLVGWFTLHRTPELNRMVLLPAGVIMKPHNVVPTRAWYKLTNLLVDLQFE